MLQFIRACLFSYRRQSIAWALSLDNDSTPRSHCKECVEAARVTEQNRLRRSVRQPPRTTTATARPLYSVLLLTPLDPFFHFYTGLCSRRYRRFVGTLPVFSKPSSLVDDKHNYHSLKYQIEFSLLPHRCVLVPVNSLSTFTFAWNRCPRRICHLRHSLSPYRIISFPFSLDNYSFPQLLS